VDAAVHVRVGGLLGWSGNPQEVTVQLVGQLGCRLVARTLAVAIEKPKPRGLRNLLPARRIWCGWRATFGMKNLLVWRRCFLQVRKLMHKHQLSAYALLPAEEPQVKRMAKRR
jgi:hypothetical protein